MDWLTRRGLIADPDDALAHLSLRLSAGLSAPAQHFYALYLLGHGVVKLVVVLMLARRIAAAYPAAIALFAAFIAWQLHRWSLTGSPVMLLSALDAAVIWLTWHEWRGARGSA